jgi:hypothetical protein
MSEGHGFPKFPRFSFAVCVRCGVLSPVSLRAENLDDLIAVGWRFDRRRFNVLATCPVCADAEEKNPDRAA